MIIEYILLPFILLLTPFGLTQLSETFTYPFENGITVIRNALTDVQLELRVAEECTKNIKYSLLLSDCSMLF